MAKTSAKNVRNALRRLGVDENVGKDTSMFGSPINYYQISLTAIQNIVDERPGYNNFHLLNIIVKKIVKLNQTNHLGLFACYKLLNKYAVEYDDSNFKSMLNWQLRIC